MQGGVPPSVLASPSLLANTSWTASGSAPVTPTSRGHSKSPRTPEFGLGESARKALSQLQDEYTEYKQEVLDNNKYVLIQILVIRFFDRLSSIHPGLISLIITPNSLAPSNVRTFRMSWLFYRPKLRCPNLELPKPKIEPSLFSKTNRPIQALLPNIELYIGVITSKF